MLAVTQRVVHLGISSLSFLFTIFVFPLKSDYQNTCEEEPRSLLSSQEPSSFTRTHSFRSSGRIREKNDRDNLWKQESSAQKETIEKFVPRDFSYWIQ